MTNPNKTLGTESLLSFPGGPHSTLLAQLIARGIKCLLWDCTWTGLLDACTSFPPDFALHPFAVINQSSLKLYAESCKSSQQTTESRGDRGGPQTQGIISASLFVSSYYIIFSDNKSYALITENLQSI